jgi:hypothetical protein
MIGTSALEFVGIRISVITLRAVTPLSIIYCAACVVWHPQSLFSKLLAAYAAAESAFFLFVYLPRRYALQAAAEHPPVLPPDERKALFAKSAKTVVDPDDYVRKWFLGTDPDEVKKENIKEFFRWAFLNTDDIEVGDEEELDGYVKGVEIMLGRDIPPGRGKAKCLKLTIDKFHPMHRPLIWYMVSKKSRWLIFLANTSISDSRSRRCIHRCISSFLRISHISPATSPILHRLSIPLFHVTQFPYFTLKKPLLLVSSAYFEDPTSRPLHPWHWHRSIPILSLPFQHKLKTGRPLSDGW